MKRSVNRSAVIVHRAEVLPERFFLIFGYVNGVLYKLVNTLVLGSRNRNNRDSEHCLHSIYVHRAAVAGHFIHHIEGDNHRNAYFKKLHGQVKVALDIGRIHDIDDAVRLFVEDEVAGDKLLAGVGRHGINPRQIGNQGILVSPYHAVLAVNRHAGEVTNVLIGTGQLVEEGGLAAVLIADKGKGQLRAGRQLASAALGVEFSFFAKSGVFHEFFSG